MLHNVSGQKLIKRDATTDIEEATALSYERDIIDVYINSWGPDDDGKIIMGPRTLTKLTLKTGVREVRVFVFAIHYSCLGAFHYENWSCISLKCSCQGRNGKGSIFVWANGNGGEEDDDCGADGYASSIYTISVGAIGVNGIYSGFDEQCSAKMVVAYVTDNHGHPAIVSIYDIP